MQNPPLQWMALAAVVFAAMAADGAEPPAVQAPVDPEHLTLEVAKELFREHSRELLAAKRAVESAEADKVIAAQRPNPTLSAGVSSLSASNWSAASGFSNKPIDTGVQLSQLIERGNKRQLRTEAAQSNLEASRSDLQYVLRQQTLAMEGAFYDLLLAQERARVSEDTLGLFRRSVDAAELRLKAGDIAASDLSRLKVDALRAENDVRQTLADREKAQLVLAYFLALEKNAARIRAEGEWPAPASVPAPKSVEELLDQRSDVQAARQRLEAARKSRDLARAARSHDVTVGVQYDHFPTQINNNTFGVSVSVPLFLFYQFDGEIKKAEVAVNSAEEDLERTRALARADIARSRADLESAQERVQRYVDSLLKEAQRAAEAAEYAYKRGAVGVTDLLDARRTWYATRLDAASAQADYAKALAAWQAATGTDAVRL
ncbi:MAG TPA: TolC family protein [Burkholderiales bacterium]|nr:TolC family protein [Burkholderiales bacterium]